mmetsp:Transcript_24136/g.91073  ORF Transcript_24136/g.91073 Transcript_24136/m.91073 type:complete len:208 (+) Transcript_24136:880-1503(+)
MAWQASSVQPLQRRWPTLRSRLAPAPAAPPAPLMTSLASRSAPLLRQTRPPGRGCSSSPAQPQAKLFQAIPAAPARLGRLPPGRARPAPLSRPSWRRRLAPLPAAAPPRMGFRRTALPLAGSRRAASRASPPCSRPSEPPPGRSARPSACCDFWTPRSARRPCQPALQRGSLPRWPLPQPRSLGRRRTRLARPRSRGTGRRRRPPRR